VAVAQLATSQEPIAPMHTSIEHTMQRGNPLTPDLHITSTAMAITYPAQYTFARGSGSGGGGGSGGDGNLDTDQLVLPWFQFLGRLKP
jgi:hypothetical protein